MVTEVVRGAAPSGSAAPVPRHVAIIMDGNGRWARERGKSRQAGHRAGTENIRRVIEQFAHRGVAYLTLYAFSTENWNRPSREVSALMRVLALALRNEVGNFHRNNIRLVHLGRIEALPDVLQRQVRSALDLTRNNTRMTVCVAFNYGSRDEIVHAVRRIVADGVAAESIDEALISSYLYTAGIPDPDLVIRTAGELRLSNFLLWQAAYAELYSTPVYWPDFDAEQVDLALAEYARRTRKFGAVVDDAGRDRQSD
ncbi:MAG: polyprenyl diphosphate synthase [Dehalococcoidia bacterium]